MKGKCYFNERKIRLCSSLHCVREKDIFTKGNFRPAFMQIGDGREPFLHLLFLIHLQIKIILMQKWHIGSGIY